MEAEQMPHILIASDISRAATIRHRLFENGKLVSFQILFNSQIVTKCDSRYSLRYVPKHQLWQIETRTPRRKNACMIIPKALMPSRSEQREKRRPYGCRRARAQYISAFAWILAFSLLLCMFLAARARETNRM
jgi:hypothetical protein